MNIYNSAEELIGKTPLVKVSKYMKNHGLSANILIKLEMQNPTGSSKDRAAKYMLGEAERDGKLVPGSTVIEPTSGNTGIGLAALAAVRGYRAIIVMPENMSPERIKLMRAYGAKVVLTKAADGMKGAVKKAGELSEEIKNSFIPDQFSNPSNPLAHFETTGPEIWNDTDGNVDIFVAGVGTGGTVSGTGKYLKSKNPDIKIFAVEPKSSPLLTEGVAGAHKIQGIGANFIPAALDRSVIDGVIDVSDDDAINAARELAKTEGILCGVSSGAALSGAKIIAQRPENFGKTIVAVMPDSGKNYLSGELFI